MSIYLTEVYCCHFFYLDFRQMTNHPATYRRTSTTISEIIKIQDRISRVDLKAEKEVLEFEGLL